MLKKILFISHESSRTGAPFVLLYFLQWLKQNHKGIWVTVISLRGGDLRKEFTDVANEYLELPIEKNSESYYQKFLSKLGFISSHNHNKRIKSFLTKVAKQDFDIVYANTVVSIPLALKFKNLSRNTKVVGHIHELETVIKMLSPRFGEYAQEIDAFVAASAIVKDNLVSNYLIPEYKIRVIYEFSKNRTLPRHDLPSSFIVGGCGTVEWRKGTDLFLQLAIITAAKYPQFEIDFVWIGGISELERIKIEGEMERAGLKKNIFKGAVRNPKDYFENFQLLAMTSREDPFPLVCIEVGMIEKPIICFKGATGTEEIIKNGGGEIVPYLDVEEMAKQIILYYQNREKLKEDGKRAKELFSEFTPSNQAPKIFEFLNSLK